jgi:hypothetical protein
MYQLEVIFLIWRTLGGRIMSGLGNKGPCEPFIIIYYYTIVGNMVLQQSYQHFILRWTSVVYVGISLLNFFAEWGIGPN